MVRAVKHEVDVEPEDAVVVEITRCGLKHIVCLERKVVLHADTEVLLAKESEEEDFA